MPYPNKLIGVTVSLITDQEKAINNQSFTTPATFIVSAEVFPTSKNTARLSANAHNELVPKVNKSSWKEAMARRRGNSTAHHGTVRNARQHGAT
ncbi:hypothetical protein LUZ63_013233 [Rhynchospora breviuscula]|uniref:Uncharacterized protein n=1 Tax=Rhynchospora breviuscula TaxID=2022672 RepID=A0A9Q0C860_9POAL|nr:hypothetical protein LUZ63_013233 [Rhynchospora breviuscula]